MEHEAPCWHVSSTRSTRELDKALAKDLNLGRKIKGVGKL